jgi:hypothetical protein
MNALALFASAASVLFVASTAHATISGVYVGASADAVQLLQIVQTPDGRLAGRLEQVDLTQDGTINDQTLALEGSADGDQIVLAPKSLLLSGNAASITGFVNGNLLDISWQGGHTTLKLADAYAFEAAVTGLKARSAIVLTARDAKSQAEARASRVQNLLAATQGLSDDVGALTRDLPAIQQRLAQTQAEYVRLQIDASHFRHRQAALNYTGALPVIAMNDGTKAQGATLDLEGLHGSVGVFHTDIMGRIGNAEHDLSSVRLSCRGLMVYGDASVQASCQEVEAKAAVLSDMRAQVVAAFDATEATYTHPAAYEPPGRKLIR